MKNYTILKKYTTLYLTLCLILFGGYSVADLNIQGDWKVEGNEVLTIGTSNISGNLTITPGSTLTGITSSQIRVAGDWINNGTFTHGQTKVYFIGDTNSTISGNNTFYDFVVNLDESDTSANKSITFDTSTSQKITNNLTIKGSSTSNIRIKSNVAGTKAKLDLSGLTSDKINVSKVDVSDSHAILNTSGNTILQATNSSTNSGNTIGWFAIDNNKINLILSEILEDSSSPDGKKNANKTNVSLAQLQYLEANNGLKNVQSALIKEYQKDIMAETNFSNLPTTAQIQAIINKVYNKSSSVKEVRPISSNQIIGLDANSKDEINKNLAGLGSLVAKKDKNGNYTIFIDENPGDGIKFSSGHNDLGDKNGILQVNGDISNLEAYISTDGNDEPNFLWNPLKNTLEEVNMTIEKIEEQVASEIIGYPLGSSNSLTIASNRPELGMTTTAPAGHDFALWGYSEGKFVAVTEKLTSNTIKTANYIKALDFGDNLVVLRGSYSLPLPLVINPDFNLVKTANKTQVVPGDVLTYTNTIENMSGNAQSNVGILDQLPPGFSYIKGSARLDGKIFSDTKVDVSRAGKIKFKLGNLDSSNTKRKISYQVRVRIGVNYGKYTATAVVTSGDFKVSKSSSFTVKVMPDALFDLATIIGKVFNDKNANEVQDLGEEPIAYAKLYSSNAQIITTDANGQYHLANVTPGRMSIKISTKDLPSDAVIVGLGNKIIDVRPGIPVKVNFAVQLPANSIVTRFAIEKMQQRPELILNVGALGGGVFANNGDFAKAIEIHMYSNYSAFIKSYKLVITRESDNAIVQEIRGEGITMLTPIILSSMLAIDSNWNATNSLSSKLNNNYNIHLEVKDKYGNVNKTTTKSLNLKPANSLKLGEAKQNLDYQGFFKDLNSNSAIEQNIRVTGKGVRVVNDGIKEIRAYDENGKLVIRIPVYQQQQNARDLLNENISTERQYIEFILPKNKFNIKVVPNKNSIESSMLDTINVEIKNLARAIINLLLPAAHAAEINAIPVTSTAKDTTTVVSSNDAIDYGDIDLSVDNNEQMLIVGIVDGKIGRRKVSGNIDLGQSGSSKYKKSIYKEGKVQLYLKGTLKGEYIITASLDSERNKSSIYDKLNLDPNYAYPIYGDESSVVDLSTETDGVLYLLIEKDESWFKWGRFNTNFNEISLATYNKGFQGAQLHYESIASDTHGQAKTQANVFAATTNTKSARNDLLSTGGKLYYLKHQQVVSNSLKLTVQVRDAVSNNVLSDKNLNADTDYSFDAFAGQVVLAKSLHYYANSDFIINNKGSNKNKIYLIAEYQYALSDSSISNSKVNYGARVQSSITDNVTVGITNIKEEQQKSVYKLQAVDSTIYLNDNNKIRIEYAQSNSTTDAKYISDNGGITWTKSVGNGNNNTSNATGKGDAVYVKGDLNFSNSINGSYYYRKIDSAFASSNINNAGENSAGVNINYTYGNNFDLRLKHDSRKIIGDEITTSSKKRVDTTVLQFNTGYRYADDKLGITAELLHKNELKKDKNSNAKTKKGTDILAVRGDYKYSDYTDISLTQQAALNGKKDHSTTVAVNHKLGRDDENDLIPNIDVGASVTVASDKKTTYSTTVSYSKNLNLNQDEDAKDNMSLNTSITNTYSSDTNKSITNSSVGVNYYKPEQNTNYQLALTDTRSSNKSDNGQTLLVGARKKMSKDTTIAYNTGVGISGNTKKNTNTLELQHQINEKNTAKINVSQYNKNSGGKHSKGVDINSSIFNQINDNWAIEFVSVAGYTYNDDDTKGKKNGNIVALAYVGYDKNKKPILKARSSYENRKERGATDRNSHFAVASVKGKYNQDVSLMANLDWGKSTNLSTNKVDTRNNRIDLGVAYRPILSDKYNIISKYTYFDEKSPSGQANSQDIEAQKGQVIAADLLYDINTKWALGSRFASRNAREKVKGHDWQNSNLWMLASRTNYKYNKNNTINIEYRHLKDANTGDVKNGLLLEHVHRLNKNFVDGDNTEIAIGYNQSGYSANLVDLNYNVKGVYVRATISF